MSVKITLGRGGSNINEEEKEIVKRISEEYYVKFERALKKIDSLDVHLKCHMKDENVKRFTVGVRVEHEGLFFNSEVEDWDLKIAARKAMIKIMNEIEHRIHAGDKSLNLRKPQNRRKRRN